MDSEEVDPRAGNKRSRLDVTIGQAAVQVRDNTTSEDRSQPRSMSYYEVPHTQRYKISTSNVPDLPPVPPPQDHRSYSQIERGGPSSTHSRLI